MVGGISVVMLAGVFSAVWSRQLKASGGMLFIESAESTFGSCYINVMSIAYKYKHESKASEYFVKCSLACASCLSSLGVVAFLILTVFAYSTFAVEPAQRSNNDVVLLGGKQLFIDDYIIDEMHGVTKVLNQPVKHPKNPLAVPDLPWEKNGFYANGSAIYDPEARLFKIWVHIWKHQDDELAATVGLYGYLTSTDGVQWRKPIINRGEKSNRVLPPLGTNSFSGQGIMKDPIEKDPARRFKMIYTENADKKPGEFQTSAAYSPDGVVWKVEPKNPLIPFGDSQNAPLWDAVRQSYVAYVRTGPPNVRGIARIESRDFVHWSPKVTVFRPGEDKIDQPFRSMPYGMKVMPYAGCFIGLINTYHWETLGPIPKDKLWQDKVNVQLAFSRNGIMWNRVGPSGAIPHADLHKDLDWESIAKNQVFLQYGKHKKEWDWGQLYSYHAPIVHNNKIWIYYTGLGSRHWSNYHGDDRPPKSGIGLATLRLDGFVSVQPVSDRKTGTLTTRPFVFLGNDIQINADANGGSVRVEVLNASGQPIKGFSAAENRPLSNDQVRHSLSWNENQNCAPLNGRQIRLKFYLDKSKLFSFTPTNRERL